MQYYKGSAGPAGLVALGLGPATEDALIKSVGIWGADFLLRPVSLGLIVIIFMSLAQVAKKLRTKSKTISETISDAS